MYKLFIAKHSVSRHFHTILYNHQTLQLSQQVSCTVFQQSWAQILAQTLVITKRYFSSILPYDRARYRIRP